MRDIFYSIVKLSLMGFCIPTVVLNTSNRGIEMRLNVGTPKMKTCCLNDIEISSIPKITYMVK